jgi:RNA polymerase sigma-70 factor (ECF subfamily)
LEAEGAEERLASPEPGPEREAEAASARVRIGAALGRLPEDQREVFLLREFGGLSFSEIADAMDCPLSTALARMRYAVLKLRGELGDLRA